MKKKIIPIILIVIFSTLLWVYVSFSGDYTINLRLPIEFKNIPEGYALSSYSATTVSLGIKGQGWQLAQHTVGRNPKFYIYCKGKRKHQTVSIRNELENNPWISSTLQIVETSPQTVSFTIEQVRSKKVEVIPIVTFNFKPGYGLVSNIKVEPDSIVVIGPKSKVKNISLVKTELRVFEGLDDSVSEVINLEKIPFINYNVDKCKITLDVQKIVDKTLENVPVQTVGVPANEQLVLTPNKIRVVLRGGIKILSKLNENDIKAYVNFVQALRDTVGAIEPKVKIPPKTKLVDIKPKRLDYIIKRY